MLFVHDKEVVGSSVKEYRFLMVKEGVDFDVGCPSLELVFQFEARLFVEEILDIGNDEPLSLDVDFGLQSLVEQVETDDSVIDVVSFRTVQQRPHIVSDFNTLRASK